MILAIVFAVVWLPLRRTRLGLGHLRRRQQPRGGVPERRPRGRDARRPRTRSAACSPRSAGSSLTATTGIGSPLSGELYTLNSVAAVVLGGVALVGGKGGLIGPIVAAFVVSIVVAILVFWGVDSNYAQVIQGALMVLVVMIGGLVVLRSRT